jgi:hypothetical protein
MYLGRFTLAVISSTPFGENALLALRSVLECGGHQPLDCAPPRSGKTCHPAPFGTDIYEGFHRRIHVGKRNDHQAIACLLDHSGDPSQITRSRTGDDVYLSLVHVSTSLLDRALGLRALWPLLVEV